MSLEKIPVLTSVVIGICDQVPALLPTLDLAFDEALRSAQIGEIAIDRIEEVEIGDGFDQCSSRSFANVGVFSHGRWNHAADDFTASSLHHEKVRARDGRVVTEKKGAGRPVEFSPES